MKDNKMYTGKKCEWDDIAIGEVFANNGCWQIWYKQSDKFAYLLAVDYLNIVDGQEYNDGRIIPMDIYCQFFEFNNEINWRENSEKNKLYKLPKSVQELWCEQ